MMKNIKSLYFTKMIFGHLSIKTKLNVCKYNKALQSLININLHKYKIFSGKYVIYETKGKGKGKEYSILTDEIIFEGEYLEGKRNGKGKEYNENGQVIFEGKYLEGKRNGKGIESCENGVLFEGEYLKGRKWNGKVYDNDGCFSEIINGEGFIKEYNLRDNLIFEGEYKNGERNGKGKEYIRETRVLLFEGEYLNNKKWNGTFYNKNNESSNLINGKGLINEYFYEGYYINGEKNGIGKEYNIFTQIYSTLIYEGEFLNGKRNGKGKEYLVYKDSKQLLFDGEYFYNCKFKGKEYYNGRPEFEGEFLLNKKWDGKGYDYKGNL